MGKLHYTCVLVVNKKAPGRMLRGCFPSKLHEKITRKQASVGKQRLRSSRCPTRALLLPQEPDTVLPVARRAVGLTGRLLQLQLRLGVTGSARQHEVYSALATTAPKYN